MTADRLERPDGPIDGAPWSRKLDAHVVSVEEPRRIHGYQVGDDLSGHYGFVEVLSLSLLGELPDAKHVEATNAALVLLSPVGTYEAPGRAALLATLSAGHERAGIEVGWVALCERATTLLSRNCELTAWLRDGATGQAPLGAGAKATPSGLVRRWEGIAPGLRAGMSGEQAALCLLHFAGFTDDGALTLLIAMAGIGCVAAEAARGSVAGFKGQPGDLPTTRLDDHV